ncbi:MAG: hypothetical protein ACYC4Q_09470, partial [Victivallaceae bacterium]
KFELENVPGYCGSPGFEYVNEIADNIINKQQPFIGGSDAVKVLKVVEAIYDAAQSGHSTIINYAKK